MNQHKMNDRKFAFERDLAPSLDPEWVHEFLMELRLQGASGDDLGEAVAEVESHTAESGETAAEAFGPPREYAQSLDLPRQPDASKVAGLLAVGPSMVQVAGMLSILWAVPGIIRGEDAVVTWGLLTVLGLVVAMIAAVGCWPRPVTQFVARRPVTGVLASLGCFGLMAIATAVFREPFVAFSPLPLLIAGGVILTLGTAWGLTNASGLDVTEDAVAKPFEDVEDVSTRMRHALRIPWSAYAPVLLPVAFTAVMTLALLIFA